MPRTSYFGSDIANPLAYGAIFAYVEFRASARQVTASMVGDPRFGDHDFVRIGVPCDKASSGGS
jgi:hypothetical protein